VKNENKVKYKETESDKCPIDLLVMQMKSGIPNKPGRYFVELDLGHADNHKEYDVDYCRQASPSDGGGLEWCKWYPHNVLRYAELPA